MSSNLDLVNALKATALASKANSIKGKETFEALFSKSLRNALDTVNAGVDPFEFEDLVISTLIILSDDAGYTKKETQNFIKELFQDDKDSPVE